MKKSKIITLALAIVIVAACFSFYGCNNAVEKITVNANVTVIDNNGEAVFGPVDVPVVRDHQPTVVEVVIEALTVNEYKYETETVTSGGTEYESFVSIGDLKEHKAMEKVKDKEEEYQYFWTYTINGVEPTSGRSFTNTVNDGDKIVYIFNHVSTAELIAAEGK